MNNKYTPTYICTFLNKIECGARELTGVRPFVHMRRKPSPSPVFANVTIDNLQKVVAAGSRFIL